MHRHSYGDGVGANGEERSLNGGRSGWKRKGNKNLARAKKPVSPVVEYIVKRLGALGVENAKTKTETVQEILRELYPQGEPPQEMATVIRVSKVLRRSDSAEFDGEN